MEEVKKGDSENVIIVADFILFLNTHDRVSLGIQLGFVHLYGDIRPGRVK